MPTLHVEVEGRVQGVGYRWFTRQCAKRKGLTGWVMNKPGGTVEVAAAGAMADLLRFRTELHAGPHGAHVTAVRDLDPVSAEELGESFVVRR